MRTRLEDQVKYTLDLDGTLVEINDFLGKPISLKHTGIIKCVSCGKVTKKSFGQGFCYPCFINSPENAECIVKPELCRGHLGEGRDLEWEKAHHVQPHYVYLALSSDVKVGVTRNIQVPTRWIDQGASQAIILAETPYRQLAGEIEVALKNYLPDKTNWQRMLKNEVAQGVDLAERKRLAAGFLPEHLQQYVAASDAITSIVAPETAPAQPAFEIPDSDSHPFAPYAETGSNAFYKVDRSFDMKPPALPTQSVLGSEIVADQLYGDVQPRID